MGQEEDRLVDVAHDAGRQDRLVVLHEEHGVRPGHVPMVDDDELGPIDSRAEADFADAAARSRTAHRRAPQEVVDRQVIDVPLASRELGEPFDALHTRSRRIPQPARRTRTNA